MNKQTRILDIMLFIACIVVLVMVLRNSNENKEKHEMLIDRQLEVVEKQLENLK